MKETAELCNCTRESVKKILDIYGITKEIRIQNGKNQKIKAGHPVAKIDKDTNKVIAIYKTVAAAERDNPKTSGHIGSVCKGKRKTAGGYKWQYI